MKTQVCRLAVVAVSSFVLSSGMSLVADTNSTTPGTPAPAAATPGTPPATDTKTQMNNPAGTTTQTSAHPREGTKKKKHHTHAPAMQTDASGDKATKTPQKDTPPSTTNP